MEANLKFIYRTTILLVLLCGAHGGSTPFAARADAKGTRYYVASDGDDANAGTSEKTAWKTLAKVSRTTFAFNDRIFLKRGDVWNERLEIKSKGAAKLAIVFGAYGEGEKPVIDGTDITIPQNQGLVQISNAEWTRVEDLEIRNSQRDGIVAYAWNNLIIQKVFAHRNNFCGISAFQGNNLTVRNSEMSHNSLDAGKTGAYAGLRLNGTIEDAQISGNKEHHNIGGPNGWANVANGIYLGQDNFPTLKGIVIEANEIYENGNPVQNQAGRGINASMRGDVLIERNTISDQSASGNFITCPRDGELSKVRVQHNLFLRNHLRAMGAGGNVSIEFFNNVAYAGSTPLPNHSYTGLAILDKTTSWKVKNNIFYLDSTNAIWRGFIVMADDVGAQAEINHNLYYSSGGNQWLLRLNAGDKAAMHGAENYPPLTQKEWQAKGYDANSIFGKSPLLVAPEKNDFHLKPNSPAIGAGEDVGLVKDADDEKIAPDKTPNIGLYNKVGE